MYQFADDTILLISRKDINVAIALAQDDLNQIVKFFFNKKIHINPDKTRTIVFHNPRISYDLSTNSNKIICHNHKCLRNNLTNTCNNNCIKINHSPTIKYLGLYLDYDMKFHSHIDQLRKTLRILAARLYHFNQYPIIVKRLVYSSLIESVVRYGITMYSLAPNYLKAPLATIIRKIQSNLFMNLPLHLIGILKFNNLIKYVYICRHYSNGELRKTKDSDYNLRQSTHSYIVARHNNYFGKGTLEYIMPSLINSLPIEFRNINNKNKAKRILKEYLIQIQTE